MRRIGKMPAFRLAIAVLAAATLAGCAMQPLYGDNAGGRQVVPQLAEVEVPPQPEQRGLVLRNHLLNELSVNGIRASKRYTLRMRIFEPEQQLYVRRDDVVSRIGYGVGVNFALFDERQQQIFSGSASYSTDFAMTNSEFSVITNRDDARDRVMQLVAKDIRTQLAAFFRGRP